MTTRAEKRQAKRAIIKQNKRAGYGPVVIFTERYERVEGSKNITFKKNYTAVTNIKDYGAGE